MPFMGGVDTHSRSSLERLKALDQLPTLDAQVGEATKLCTHGARAEMIVRWTVDKLRQSSEARVYDSIWTLLGLAIRLLSPSRIATVLGSSSFHDLLLTTLSEPNLSRSCVHAVEEVINLLLQMGKNPGAAAVKAVLSADNATAAIFCGSWLRSLVDQYHNAGDNDAILQSEDSLNVATAVWALRKNQGDEDALFTDHCFVHVLELLFILERDVKSSSMPKRSHSNALKSAARNHHELRLLLARHCILPARAAFNASRGPTTTRPSHEVQEQSRATLDNKLEILRTRLAQPMPQHLLNAIPLLLEVALLCITLHTPRHRDREQPWMDHLFTALVGCIFSVDVSVQTQTDILTNTLDIIHRHGSLSSTTLMTMTRNRAFQDPRPASRNHWQLVMKIVELNADVFTDTSLAALLFDAVSNETMSEIVNVNLAAAIKVRILEPVMIAFASGRGINRFITLWGKQLLRVGNDSDISIWVQLIPSFAKLLESTIPSDQFMELFEATHSPLKTMGDTKIIPNTEELNASFTLINAFLEGVQNDELVDRVHDIVHELLQNLLDVPALLAENGMLDLQMPYWTCLAGAFNIWFPLWASQNQDHDAVRQMFNELITHQTFEAALALCKQQKSVCPNLNKHRLLVQQAGGYAMAVCEAGSSFKDEPSARKAFERTATLFARTKHQCHRLFVKYPAMLTFIGTPDRKRFFQEVIEAASESTIDDLHAFTNAVMTRTTPDIRESWTAILFGILSCNKGDEVEKTLYGRALAAALAIPSECLTKEQRQHPLKALIATSNAFIAADGAHHFRKYLAWILQLIHPPSVQPSQHLSLQQLWQFSQVIDTRPKLIRGDDDSRRILESLARRIISSWMIRQAQQKTNEQLMEFTEIVERNLSDVKNNNSDKPATVIVTNVFIRLLCDIQPEPYTKGASMRSSNTIQHHLESQWKEASRIARLLKKHSERDTGAIWRSLYDILETVAAAPMNPTTKIDKYRYSLLELASELSSGSPLDEFEPVRRSAVIKGFHLAGKYSNGADTDLLTAATKLLDYRYLSALEHHEVVTTVSKALENSTASARTFFLNELFKKEHDVANPYLVLRQAVVAIMPQEDVDQPENATYADILLRTLSVATDQRSVQATRCALQTTNIILREKRSLVDQHGIEQTISTLHRLLAQSPYVVGLYNEICQSTMLILTHYRTRVQDRMHLLVALLQEALSVLIKPSGAAPPQPKLTARHAHAYTRLLVVLCNRHAHTRSRGKTSALVDEARKVQARTGQYVQFILHRYCAAVLAGVLDSGVREALQPGLWAVVEAIEASGPEGIKALSAAMDHSERAVLRSVYDEWKRFGKWEGL